MGRNEIEKINFIGLLYNSVLARILGFLLLSGPCFSQLSVSYNQDKDPFLVYNGKLAFGYGASPQRLLTYLPRGRGNDYQDWLEWASLYSMNHVRSYPPSIIVESPALNLFKVAPGDKEKRFDLSLFNEKYFEELRKACSLMRDKGFFVHLQFWQSVAWKKFWEDSYYNPANNVNPEISRSAGPGEFMVMDNPELLGHQKEYVRRLLEATADLGNVYYDIANEIGNGTGNSNQWVLEIIATINEWEEENKRDVLLTINDEGGMRLENIATNFKHTDLIVKDLGRWDEHVDTKSEYRKPTVSVRNIDWNYKTKERLYFWSDKDLEVTENHNYQIRGRKYWWRMFMAKVQMAGGYADDYNFEKARLLYKTVNKVTRKLGLGDMFEGKYESTYRRNTLSENNFQPFRRFVDTVEDYVNMQPRNDLVDNHPSAHQYVLHSDREIVVYFESPNGEAGYNYERANITIRELRFKNGIYEGYFYEPASSVSRSVSVSITAGVASLNVPAFSDDLALHIKSPIN